MHNFTSTNPNKAIDAVLVECFEGDHVAHITNQGNDRTVAVRRWKRPDGSWTDQSFTLTFSDPTGIDLRKSCDEVQAKTWKEATRLILNFMVGARVNVTDDWYQDFINQADREVEIVKVTKTRVRIEYWLPNSGQTGAWRACTTVGDYRYLRAT